MNLLCSTCARIQFHHQAWVQCVWYSSFSLVIMQKMSNLTVASVRVVTIEEVPEGEGGELQTILVDSGADAAVFPERFATAGMAAQASSLQLHDAQGRSIPVMGMRDLEIHLTDETGRRIVLQEQVAISSFVQQPILCDGRLMQCGWGVSATDQSLVHSTGIKVPLEMQNQSMVVRGVIRAISGSAAGCSCSQGSCEA